MNNKQSEFLELELADNSTYIDVVSGLPLKNRKLKADNLVSSDPLEESKYKAASTFLVKEVKTELEQLVAENVGKDNEHLADFNNPHNVTKEQVGLPNVDDTSDVNKPVSIAQAAEIKIVQDNLNTHKADINNPHQVTKEQIGLGNVDNISDANKPISVIQQNALNLKADKSIYIIAGRGLTGGGDISSNRSLNIVSTDDSIVVDDNSIKVDTQDVLNSNSTTKPLSAKKGKELYDTKVSKTGNETIDGIKTFNLSPIIPTPTTDMQSSTKKYVDDTKISIQSKQVIAGTGLTGGGDLSADRTINIVSADDGITVNADNIKLNPVDNLTSTSVTQPLAANQGKVLNDNITQIGADLNTSIADEKSMFPAIAYNKRVLADGGTVISKQSVIDGYKTMIDLLPNTKLLCNINSGIKTRTVGLNSYLTKAYDMGIGGVDLTQTTDANQPYLSGNIAPNEKRRFKTVGDVTRSLSHNSINFNSSDSWSFTIVLKSNKVESVIAIGASVTFVIDPYTILMRFDGTTVSVSRTIDIGKSFIFTATYNNGSIIYYINGINVLSTVYLTSINFDGFSTGTSYKSDIDLYYFQILNKALSKSEIESQYSYLRSQYPEIEGVNIGNQHWATSNYEGVVTGNGTIIPEVKDAAAWAALTTPAWCYYNNDPALGSVYGKLYNYYAVQEIAKNPPKGWRVPMSADFAQLNAYLGGNTIAGGKLKKEGLAYWNTPNTGATNESGFSAIAGGIRLSDGSFGQKDSQFGIYTNSIYRFVIFHNEAKSYIADTSSDLKRGYSIRLLRNSPVGDQIQNISTGVFTTNIAAGTANKDLSIPFGYEVKAINVLATTAITNFKCDLYNTIGVLQQNLLTGKSASANVPIKFGVSADANIQYTDPILRFNCTGNSGSGMEIQVILNKIL